MRITWQAIVLALAMTGTAMANPPAGAAAAASKDWPQWRGPERNGAANGASLASQWPAAGPAKLWQSERLPSAFDGGYSSPVVAGGKVYLFVNAGPSMGRGTPPAPGPGGVPEFSNAPAQDYFVCMNAADGKTLWKKEYAGKANAASSTPCVADGKLYGVISEGKVVCLDVAKNGQEVWAAPFQPTQSSILVADGKVVAMGKPLTAFNAADGKPAWTCPQVSSETNSVALWRKDGKGYLLCNTAQQLFCVALADGKLLWSASGGGMSSAAVSGDYAAVQPQRGGLIGYKLSLGGAEKLWTVDGVGDTAASPVIANGRVYAIGRDMSACVDLATGKEIWKDRPGRGNICSPIVADGKLITLIDNARKLLLIDAAGDAYKPLASASISGTGCTSPALADGKLYVRLTDGVACYNLGR